MTATIGVGIFPNSTKSIVTISAVQCSFRSIIWRNRSCYTGFVILATETEARRGRRRKWRQPRRWREMESFLGNVYTYAINMNSSFRLLHHLFLLLPFQNSRAFNSSALTDWGLELLLGANRDSVDPAVAGKLLLSNLTKNPKKKKKMTKSLIRRFTSSVMALGVLLLLLVSHVKHL